MSTVQHIYLRRTRPKYYRIFSASDVPQTPEMHFDEVDDAIEWAMRWASGEADYCLNLELDEDKKDE